MHFTLLAIALVLIVCTLQHASAAVCQHGAAFIDECDNQCTCLPSGAYGCTRKACRMPGTTAGQPKKCSQNGDISVGDRVRVVCRFGITMFELVGSPRRCTPGITWRDGCNTCTCRSDGSSQCTEVACVQQATSRDDEPQQEPGCRYGPHYVDECGNTCTCQNGRFYGCTLIGCEPGRTSEKPMSCQGASDLPSLGGRQRAICHEGIVKVQSTDDACLPGSQFKDDCNMCSCSSTGISLCTLMGCDISADITETPLPILTCDGYPQCPADCGRKMNEEKQCWNCQCGLPLTFGDVVVGIDKGCPAGLRHGQNSWATRSCSAQDCEPGSSWELNDRCSNCTCLTTREPACTPCLREPNRDTVTCEDRLPRCPADCGQVFNTVDDCYDCPCGLQRVAGDIVVPINQQCPEGTDAREHGAFTKSCAPFDQLPQGDTRVCHGTASQCPQDCGLLRVAPNEGCVHCQCGPKLEEGDEMVQHGRPCPIGFTPVSTTLAGRICRPPNKDDCTPGVRFNSGHNTCICLQSRKAACTKRPDPDPTSPHPNSVTPSSLRPSSSGAAQRSTPFYFN